MRFFFISMYCVCVQLKKSRSDAEDRRRKSLLPWHRKNRSKSKDRGESEYSKARTRREQFDTVSIRSDVTSSRSSLASWDLALRGSLSRQVSTGQIFSRNLSSKLISSKLLSSSSFSLLHLEIHLNERIHPSVV